MSLNTKLLKDFDEQAYQFALQKCPDFQGISLTFAKKFAELIIRECNSRVVNYINECGEIATLPDDVILGHFGIEDGENT
jgi:hypothetical protein